MLCRRIVGGLRDEIGGFVSLLKPRKLTEAIAAARVQEMTVEAISKRNKPISAFHRPVGNSGESSTVSNKVVKPQFQGNNYNMGGGNLKDNIGCQIKKLTHNEMQARREKGLYFNCDEIYRQGHRCKFKQIYMIIGDDEWEEECKEEPDIEVINDSVEHQTEMAISLHALNGNTSETTLRIKATVKGREIILLIDTGSTHNFLNSSTAEKLHCTLEEDKPMQVSVADGYKNVVHRKM